MAGLAAAALAAAGLVGAGTAADAAITTQPAGVSITVDNTGANTALVSSAVVANVTVKNNSASSTIGVFTVVVPAGVSPVQAVGVQGPGNWRQTVLPCGTTANCSALVVVYASLPLSSSVVRPGQSVTSSIRFTTPAAPTTLGFRFLGIGNGLFTTTDAPSINVINGVAGSWCVQNPGNVVAGTTKTFTVQAVSDGNECKNVDKKKIGVAATTMTVKFKTDDSAGGIVAGASTGPLTGGSTITVALSASSTGLYTFSGTFTAAGNQSIDAGTSSAAGNSGDFTVLPDVPAAVTVKSVVDKVSGTTSLASGAVFVTTYTVSDRFGNAILTPSSGVSIAVTNGDFTRTGGANPFPGGPGANPGEVLPATDGTVEGTYGGSGRQSLTASVGAVVSATTILVPSTPASVTFAETSVGSAILFPGVAATVDTAPCTPGTNCAESNLPNGANGLVTFGAIDCTDVTVGLCGRTPGTRNLVDLEANFKTVVEGAIVELYDAAHPASITLHCTVTDCPEIHDDAFDDDHPVNEPGDVRNSQDARVDDFKAYAPFAQLSFETALGLTKVGSCQPAATIKEYGPAIPAFTSVPGPRQVCVDVTSFFRDGSGNLSATLYFYEDIKGMMG
jgi:hypothetical protein